MFRSISSPWIVVVAVTLLSAVLVIWRAQVVATVPEAVNLGQRVQMAFGYVVGSVIFALVAMWLYRWLLRTWPASGANVYQWLAIGLTIAFSVLAVIALPMMHKKGIPEFIALNLIWGAGYGWLLPLALS